VAARRPAVQIAHDLDQRAGDLHLAPPVRSTPDRKLMRWVGRNYQHA